MNAFLSYQTTDKAIAGEIGAFLRELGIASFLAHEDIEVSHQWQVRIFEELARAELFVAVLSTHYLTSPYCLQESGVAIARGAGVTIAPLSIDGTIPPRFMGHIQASRLDP